MNVCVRVSGRRVKREADSGFYLKKRLSLIKDDAEVPAGDWSRRVGGRSRGSFFEGAGLGVWGEEGRSQDVWPPLPD